MLNTTKKLLLGISITLSSVATISACSSATHTSTNTASKNTALTQNLSYSERLAYYKNKNPEQEAQKAIQAGKRYRMTTASRRGIHAPGLDRATFERIQAQCQSQLIHGMSDAIKNREHLEYQKYAFTYASRFNKVMARHC